MPHIKITNWIHYHRQEKVEKYGKFFRYDICMTPCIWRNFPGIITIAETNLPGNLIVLQAHMKTIHKTLS